MGFLYDNTFIEMKQQNERASKDKQMRETLNQQASNGSVRESMATEYHEIFSNEEPIVNVNESHGSLQQQYNALSQNDAQLRKRQANIARLVQSNLGTEDNPTQTSNFAAMIAQNTQPTAKAKAKSRAKAKTEPPPEPMDESESMDQTLGGMKRQSEGDDRPKAKSKLIPKHEELLRNMKSEGHSKKEIEATRRQLLAIQHHYPQPEQASSSSTPAPKPATKAAPAPKAEPQASSSSAAAPGVKKPQFEKQHGTKLEHGSRSFWKNKPVEFIRDQLQLRGKRFTKKELKGKDKIKRDDYLNMIFEIDGI